MLDWIFHREAPLHKKATHARHTVACWPEKEDPCHTKTTAGGDQLEHHGDVSMQASTMETFKILVNSALSTPKAKLPTGDTANVCLGSASLEAKCVHFRADLVPTEIIEHHNLEDKIHNGCVCAKLKKAWHRLKQSGKIAHDDLVEHPQLAGHHKTKTEGLFKHESKDVAFHLAVDDFAAKHSNKEDAEELIAHTQEKHTFKVDWEGKRCTGTDVNWDCKRQTAIPSVKGCAVQAL